MNITKYYAYIHIKPDGVPFYVGKGTLARAGCMNKGRRNQHHINITNKYGVENICVGKLGCSNEEIAFDLEVGIIKCLRRIGVKLANATLGGKGALGFKFPAKAIAKRIGNTHRVGYKASAETKAKMSASHKANPLTSEARAKISAFHTGNKHALGYTHTESAKAKMSVSHLGNNYGVGNANALGYRHTDKAKAAMSVAHMGHKLSDETRAKISSTKNKNRQELTDKNKAVRPRW